MTLKLDGEDKKETVLNVRIVEEPIYGVTPRFNSDDPHMSTHTQSQKIETYLRWIYYFLGAVIVGLFIIAIQLFMILDGFQVWTTVELR